MFLKVNVDGAIFKGVGDEMGVVISQGRGGVCGARNMSTSGTLVEVSVAKAKEMVLGLKLSIQCGARKVVVESDCFQVIKLVIDRGDKRWSVLGNYWQGNSIREVANFIYSISFVHVYRQDNLAAHIMAYLNPLEFSTRVWIRGCPSIVQGVIAFDFCLINNEN